MGAGIYSGPPRCFATIERDAEGHSIAFCDQLTPDRDGPIGSKWTCPKCGEVSTLIARGGPGPAPEPVLAPAPVQPLRAAVLEQLKRGPVSCGNLTRRLMGVGTLSKDVESYELVRAVLVDLMVEQLVLVSGNGKGHHYRLAELEPARLARFAAADGPKGTQ